MSNQKTTVTVRISEEHFSVHGADGREIAEMDVDVDGERGVVRWTASEAHPARTETCESLTHATGRAVIGAARRERHQDHAAGPATRPARAGTNEIEVTVGDGITISAGGRDYFDVKHERNGRAMLTYVGDDLPGQPHTYSTAGVCVGHAVWSTNKKIDKAREERKERAAPLPAPERPPSGAPAKTAGTITHDR